MPFSDQDIDVTIVMPCLNEAESIDACIASARRTLDKLARTRGLKGEILVADNGSSDGSQQIATRLGARVVAISHRGYGSALIGGFRAARGRYLVMGDADGSYEFDDAVPMIEALIGGADLCMGTRFQGGIKPGAMPWKNRYIGNPLLTGVLNLLYGAGIDDAHCGLRAMTRSSFERLKLCGSGMEFASEMVVKAALLGEKVVQCPVTLSPDLRGRPPHLRPWRDGWRHLRYLLMLSPAWLFAGPATLAGLIALLVLLASGEVWVSGADRLGFFGNYWVILAGSLLELSHIAAILALACHLYGIREGYRRPGPRTASLSCWLSLETMLASGLLAILAGLGILFGVVVYWSQHDFGPIGSVLPAVVGTLLFAIGAQNILGGFLLAVVGGNEAQFLLALPERTRLDTRTQPRPAALGM
jgi:glycosyltransferase involved in cell wall biosynthesis